MRLGDLDALRKNMEFICMGIMAGTEPYNAPLTEIDNAPTVEVDEMTQDLINKVNVNIGLAKPIKDERPQGERAERALSIIDRLRTDGHINNKEQGTLRRAILLPEKPQGDLADEVWKLYEKHQSHLATHVIEFGDELKDLLGKYQKGGAE